MKTFKQLLKEAEGNPNHAADGKFSSGSGGGSKSSGSDKSSDAVKTLEKSSGKKLSSDESSILSKLIDGKEKYDFMEYVSTKFGLNIEKMRDALKKAKIEDSGKAIEFFLDKLKSEAGIKRFRSTRGY